MSDPNHGYPTYGAWLRSKSLKIGYCGQGGQDATRQKEWDRELSAYNDALRQGVEPAGTSMRQVRQAMEVSDAVGKPYDATTGKFEGQYFNPSTKEFI